MTDRELMQQALDWMDRNGEVVFAQSGLSAVLSMNLVAEALRARLAQPEPVLVTPHEFVKQVEGKENVRGIPVMMARWPMQEWGDSKVTNPEFVAEQKAMNEALRSMVHPEPEPYGYIARRNWKMPVFIEADNVEATGLPYNNADYEPVFKAPPQREWKGLTDEELLDLADMAYVNDLELLQTLQIKLKEKNTWQP